MGTTKSAIIKKNYIINKIMEQSRWGMGYDEKKLISEFILDMNTTRKTALELIKVFDDAGRIIRKDNKIYSKTFFNDDLTFKEETIKEEFIETIDNTEQANKEADEVFNGFS